MEEDIPNSSSSNGLDFDFIWLVFFISLPLDFLLKKNLIEFFIDLKHLFFAEIAYLILSISGIALCFLDSSKINSLFSDISIESLKDKKEVIVWLFVVLLALIGICILFFTFISNLGLGVLAPLVVCVSGIASLIQTLKNQESKERLEGYLKSYNIKTLLNVFLVFLIFNFRLLHLLGVVLILFQDWGLVYYFCNYFICVSFFYSARSILE